MLGLSAFLVTYGAVSVGYWIQSSWLAPVFEFESLLPFLALFEVGIVGVGLAAIVMLSRRRGELDAALAEGAPSEARRSPLGAAERHGHILRSMSRQVDSLLLWIPLAILMTVLCGLVLLASSAFGAAISEPTARIAAFALTILGVPVAVTVFGVGSLGGIRSTTRHQHQLSEGGQAWLDPTFEGPPEDEALTRGSLQRTSRAAAARQMTGAAIISEARARGRRERRVVLATALAALLGLSGLTGLLAIDLDCASIGGLCNSGTEEPVFAGIVLGIVALGLLAPSYVAVMAARRTPGTFPPPAANANLGSDSSRVSDEIAVVAQIETFQNRLREDSRDSLWLTWFGAIWIVTAGVLVLPSVGALAYSWQLSVLADRSSGVAVGILLGQGLAVLLPVPIAALATLTWLERRSEDAKAGRAYRALLRGYALLEQGFWERF